MTKGQTYLVFLSILPFILIVLFFVARIVLNPPKSIIKSFTIVDGYLYPSFQQGRITLIKPPRPIRIKDIVRIKLTQVYPPHSPISCSHRTFLVFLMGSVSYKFYSFCMVSVLSSTYRISVLLASKDYYIGASRWFHLMDSSLLL